VYIYNNIDIKTVESCTPCPCSSLLRANLNAPSSDKDISHTLKLRTSHSDNSQVTIQVGCIHCMLVRIKQLGRHGPMQESHQGWYVPGDFASSSWLQQMILKLHNHSSPLIDRIAALGLKYASGIKYSVLG
jgi:hypothetical protein